MNLTKQEKKQLRVSAIILLAYLATSVFLWLHYSWWAGLIPTIIIICAEYSLQIRKYKTLKTPAIVWAVHQLRRLKTAICRPHVVVVNHSPAIADQTKLVAKLITSISNLLFKDFVQVVAYSNYELLGTGTQEQKEACFSELYSQYEAARENERIKDDVVLKKQLLALETRKAAIEFNIGILKERYSMEAVRGLQYYFKDHYGNPLYSFSLQTLEADIKKVIASEIANKIKYKQLADAYAKLHDGKKTASTPDAIERNFMDTVIWIKEALKISFDENTISTLAYARMEARAGKMIKHQEEQLAKQKK